MRHRIIAAVLAAAALVLTVPAAAQATSTATDECVPITPTDPVTERVWHTWTGGPVDEAPAADADGWQPTSGAPQGGPHEQPDGVPYRVGEGNGDWFLWRTVVVTPATDGRACPERPDPLPPLEERVAVLSCPEVLTDPVTFVGRVDTRLIVTVYVWDEAAWAYVPGVPIIEPGGSRADVLTEVEARAFALEYGIAFPEGACEPVTEEPPVEEPPVEEPPTAGPPTDVDPPARPAARTAAPQLAETGPADTLAALGTALGMITAGGGMLAARRRFAG